MKISFRLQTWSYKPGEDNKKMVKNLIGEFIYLELRRALIRARTDTKNAPAEPTTARIAVGFSGELMQPSCPYSGRATEERRAIPASTRQVFFICVLNWEGTVTKVESQRRMTLSA